MSRSVAVLPVIDRRRALVDAVALLTVAATTWVTAAAAFHSAYSGLVYLAWVLLWVGVPQLVQGVVLQRAAKHGWRSRRARAILMLLVWAATAFAVGALVPFVEAAPSLPLGLTAAGICVVSLSVIRPLASTVVPSRHDEPGV